MKLSSVLCLATAIGTAVSQAVTWTDEGINFIGKIEEDEGSRFGFVWPSEETSQEFIGQMVVSKTVGWAGVALGGSMANNLLVVAWPNGNEIVSSTRWTTSDDYPKPIYDLLTEYQSGYFQPSPYEGPKLTTIKSTVNATHWNWIYRCENCTQWDGIGQPPPNDATGFWVLAYVFSYYPPQVPSDRTSDFNIHNYFGMWGQSVDETRRASYRSWLPRQEPTVSRSTVPEPTTSAPPATTTPPPSTTVEPPTTTAPTTTAPPVAATPYDYIVVGAGAAGLVVADRLSESGKSVLLLERGGPSSYITGNRDFAPWLNDTQYSRFDVPGLFQGYFGNTGPTYWFCKDVSSFAGCILGGGTSVNGGLYWYPVDIEFAAERGWPSTWVNHQPFTEKLKARLPATDIPSPDGKRYLEESYDVMKEVLSGMGYDEITLNDFPNRKDAVFGHSAYNFQNGLRWGPVRTYLQTAQARPNFKLVLNTLVSSVKRNGSTVLGVQTDNHSIGPYGFVPLTATGRVVLSSGSFGSPRILFQSGIGPRAQLDIVRSNVAASSQLPSESDYIINEEVGRNVQDNPSINLMFTHPSVDSYDNWAPIWDDPREEDKQLYRQYRAGVFASSSPRMNFWKAIVGADNVTRYLQGTVRPGFDVVNTEFPYDNKTVFSVTTYLSTGITSRGRIGLTDETLQVGILDGPWINDNNDKAALIKGITDLVEGTKKVANLTLITPDNTTTIVDYVENYGTPSMNSNHWVGSCSIQKVVDQNAKVIGTDNLFVVDASIIPAQPMGNPQGFIMAVAEQGAAKILALPPSRKRECKRK